MSAKSYAVTPLFNTAGVNQGVFESEFVKTVFEYIKRNKVTSEKEIGLVFYATPDVVSSVCEMLLKAGCIQEYTGTVERKKESGNKKITLRRYYRNSKLSDDKLKELADFTAQHFKKKYVAPENRYLRLLVAYEESKFSETEVN